MKKSLLLLLCLISLVSGKVIADVGDTLSYCGNSALSTRIGVNNTTTTIYWGIMLPATQLTGRDSVMSVQLYVGQSDSGTYTVSIYQGGTTAPQTQIYTHTYYFGTADVGGYVDCVLEDPVYIASNQNLWVIISNTDVLYPAAACTYTGDPNSNWISTDGSSWTHASTSLGLPQNYSWLIKCVTHTSANAVPSVIAYGPTMAAVGEQLTFSANASSGATISWQLNGGTPSTATGNTATATWNTPGTYNVIAIASNANGTSRDTVVLHVFDCQEVNAFPYVMGFEADDPVACWSFVDADGDSYSWDPSVFSLSSQAHTGDGCIASASFINGIGALTPDNWLVSPHIYLPQDNGFTLSWYAAGVDQTYFAEHYGVYISTTGMNPSDFQLLQEYDITSTTWTQKTLNLDQYAGQHVYIAFRHFDITDMYWLKLDDVTITMQQPSRYNVTFVCEGNIVGNVDTLASGSNPSLCGEQVSLSSNHTTNIYITCQKFEYHLDALYVNDENRIGDVNINTGDIEDVYVFAFQPVEPSVIRAVFVGRDMNVNVVANPSQGGTVSGGGTYHYLDTVRIEAHPNPGYVFVGWQDGNTSNPRDVVVTGNVTYTANFEESNGINISGAQSVSLTVYPNPAVDATTLSMSGVSGEVLVSIVDLNGRSWFSEVVVCGNDRECSYRFDVSSLPQGHYFVCIKGDDVNLVRRFVK